MRRAMHDEPRDGCPGTHPNPEVLIRFGKGNPSSSEAREVVAHLLRQCPYCAEILRYMVGGPLLDPDLYEPVFERAFASGAGLRKRAHA
jgi:hypothetical protein